MARPGTDGAVGVQFLHASRHSDLVPTSLPHLQLEDRTTPRQRGVHHHIPGMKIPPVTGVPSGCLLRVVGAY